MFISYRREDAPAHAGRLYDHLVERFGESRVFMDVDSIGLGLDWVEVLRQAVEACEVMLVLIGPGWAGAAAPDGARRLDDPDDYVRLEIETALDRGIRVVPVLVHGGELPVAEALPGPLRRLVRRQSLEVGDATFRSDVALLIERLDAALGRQAPRPPRLDETLAPATPRPARSDPGGRPWRARLEERTRSRRRLVVELSHSSHTLEYRLRMLLSNELRLDGHVVGAKGLLESLSSGEVQAERYEFTLTDGDVLRRGVMEVRLGATDVAGVTLRVDDQVLHSDR